MRSRNGLGGDYSPQVGQRIGFLQERRSRGRIRLQADVIVNRIPKTLLAPEVSLRRLDGDVTQQKLNLLQFAACLMAQSCTGPSQIVRCDGWQAAAFRVYLHNCPDHLGRKAVSPNSACFVDRPQQRTCVDAGTKGPAVDRLLYPFRNGDRPDVATFSSQVRHDPMAFPKLEILEP